MIQYESMNTVIRCGCMIQYESMNTVLIPYS